MGEIDSETQDMLAAETELFSNALDRRLHFSARGNLGGSPVSTSATDGKNIDINPVNPVADTEDDFHSLFSHEIAHILFKSNHYIPLKLSKEKEFEKIPLRVIATMYNIVEDHRIEQNYIKVFPGAEEGFKVIKPRLMQNPKPHTIKDPINTLLAVRCDMKEAVEKGKMTELYEKCETEMAKLKDKGYTASYPVLKTILGYVKDFYKKEIEHACSGFPCRTGERRKSGKEGEPGEEEGIVEGEGREGEPGSKEGGKEGGKGKGRGSKEGGEGSGGKSDKTTGGKGEHTGKSTEGGSPSGPGGTHGEESEGGGGTGRGHVIVMTEDDLKKLGIDPKDIPEGKKPEDLTEGDILVILIGKDVEKARETSPMLKDEEDKLPDAKEKEKKDIDGLDKKSEKEILDKAEKESKEERKDVETAVSAAREREFDKDLSKILTTDPGDRTYDMHSGKYTSEKIRRVLATVKAKATDIPAFYGKKMDIRRAIQKVIRPDREVKPFYRHHNESGAEYWFLIDLSGSMAGSSLRKSKEILATLYDSVVPYNPNVKFRMFGFEGGELGTETAMRHPPRVFEFDRTRLPTLEADGDNPTGAALYRVTDIIRKSTKRADRSLFIITDGIQNGDEELDAKTGAVKVIAKGIKKVKATGTKVFTIFLDPGETYKRDRTIQSSFKDIDHFYGIRDISEARKILEDEIVTDVAKRIMV